jgi:superfamily II DNA or RNA helicase
MGIELRPYQQADIEKIRREYAAGATRVCYQAPTGSGKTVLFAHVVAGAVARGNRVVILGHRDEIVRQVSSSLNALDVVHGVIAAGYPESPGAVHVASVQTLARRLGGLRPPDLIVIDEAHHTVAGTWLKILAAFPNARVLGVTATPERLDGKGLSDVFQRLVLGPTVESLIGAGFLSKFVTYAPPRDPDLSGVGTRMGDYATGGLSRAMSRSVIIAGAVDEYARICPGAPAIVFCVDVAHSEKVAAAFAERGYRAAHVDGETPRDHRRGLIAALGSGDLQVLCNCGLISEGLDVPGVAAAVLLRPTKSLALISNKSGARCVPRPGKSARLFSTTPATRSALVSLTRLAAGRLTAGKKSRAKRPCGAARNAGRSTRCRPGSASNAGPRCAVGLMSR